MRGSNARILHPSTSGPTLPSLALTPLRDRLPWLGLPGRISVEDAKYTNPLSERFVQATPTLALTFNLTLALAPAR